MNSKLTIPIISLIAVMMFISTPFIFTVQSVPPVTQQTWIVDSTGAGDYTSIQDAIDIATGGDIIRIQSGVYIENNLKINKMITIIGEGSTDTIINCDGKPGIEVSSPSVDISNLKIINSIDYGIQVSDEKCKISNIIIEKHQYIGIWVRGSNAEITDCNIIGLGPYGDGIRLRQSNSVVKRCNIQSFSTGVSIMVDSDNHLVSDCNLFDNQIGLDIRIRSNNNIVTGCNIYANDKGVWIWQNSMRNKLYLNNFWRNEIDADPEDNNTWDNEEQGNYWEDYDGLDNNDDGIGDTPYTLSNGNVDRYPLTSMILPDEITAPTGVKCTSSSADNTPTFTWNPSVYNKGIKEYVIKIDDQPEKNIGDTTTWASTESISDGVHTFYIRAIGNDETSSGYSIIEFSIDTIQIDSDSDGWSDDEEETYGTDPNNPDNYPLDTDGDRTPDSADTDDDNDGYPDEMEQSYGTNTKISSIYPTDIDDDKLPDEDSPDGKYTGDTDDDDDGLADTIEDNLGSNSKTSSDVKRIYINGKPYYLVDATQEGTYDILYNPDKSTTTAVEKQDQNYLIDENGDGTYEYIYNTADGSISSYGEQIELSIWVLIGIVITIIALIIILYYIKQKPSWISKKIFKKPQKITKLPPIVKPKDKLIEDKDTTAMIGQTRNLLQHIQKDVEIYMEKLSQLEDKIEHKSIEETKSIPPIDKVIDEKVETTPISPIEIKKDAEEKNNIEDEVDKLLSKLEEKDKSGKSYGS